MRVVLYAINNGTSQRGLFSVASEVDEVFWSHHAVEMIRVSVQLPLGIAENVCRLLNEHWSEYSNGGSGKRRGEPQSDWREDFRREVQLLWESDGEQQTYIVENVALAPHRRLSSELVEQARQASAYMAGRSLLREEASQLLDSVMPAERRHDVEALAALQLAALLGALQLTAAVAPKPVAPPPSGFRAWIERLRPARLLALASAAQPRRAAKQALACRRCGSSADKLRRTPCAACGQRACAYCEACLTMGRSRECELLVLGLNSPPVAGSSEVNLAFSEVAVSTTLNPASLEERWGLSPAQSTAAAQALKFLNTPRDTESHSLATTGNLSYRHSHTFLLWAVTGAGKTEMIFPLLESVLARGGRALVATPRRDVVLELAPRLAKAFPTYTRTVLYGGSTDRWENGALTLATTHQLLRFQEAFDLVLIDELDAFPYHNDPMLHYAADKCRRQSGATVLLSATPPQQLQKAALKRQLPHARVPVRYHRHPLPVPKRLVIPAVSHLLRLKKLPLKLLNPLRHSLGRGAQVFVFVPYVRQVEPFVQLLRQWAAKLNINPQSIAGTSSKDEDRTSKVTSFRDHSINLLVTTTILERGVTIPKSDVFILDAHNPLFDAASLVQMAGRAGRSAADPFGFVFYGAPVWTVSQRNAINQIRSMNSLARKNGFLQ